MSAFFILLFIAAILFSIGLHEFGHFAMSKRFGIKVHEFFIGFGPRLWSVRRGETEYGVKALPLGGYVKIAGMNPLEEIAPEDEARVFKAKKPWKRAIVLAAGSFTHFFLGLLILSVILVVSGRRDFDNPIPVVAGIQDEPLADGRDAPAKEAGLKVGDRITAIDGLTVKDKWDRAVGIIHARAGEEVTIAILRDGEQLTLGPVELATHNPNTDEDVGYLGVSPDYPVEKLGPWTAIGAAGSQVGEVMKRSLFAFGDIFSPDTISRLFRVAAGNEPRSLEDPATLIGVGGVAGSLGRAGDFVGLFYLIAGFNIFIGVANLLPLPPLDGGHLAVLAYEKVSKRDVDMRRLLPLTATVIAIFGSLFMLLLYLDLVAPLPPL